MPSELAQLAEGVLRAMGRWRLPVDPFEIAKQEGIIVKPRDYSDGFDARIEYYPGYNRFCIYYNEPEGLRTDGRVHFSIAHELGHYYIDEHYQRLLAGKVHDSDSDFASRDKREAEADEFAAELLMPMELFRAEVKTFLGDYCTLKDISKLANRLGTSITSTARRYCQSDLEPCTIFFSEDKLIRWGMGSGDMQYLGLSYFKWGTSPPAKSKTTAVLAAISRGEPVSAVEGVVDADVWFDRTFVRELWEEVRPIGKSGRVITQLTPHRR